MKYLSVFLLIVQAAFALHPDDSKEINHIIEHITNTWNAHAGHGFADDYTQDADFVNIFGMVFSGKEEIEDRHVKILETFLKGSTLEVVDCNLREALPNVVIAHVYWKVIYGRNDSMRGVFTHVLLKNQDKWVITASQNTLTQE